MKTFLTSRSRILVLPFAALLNAPQLASAVEMYTSVSTPSQWGTGSGFYHGHTVMAATRFNVLNAGGNFIVQCNHPSTVLMAGERALGSTTWGLQPNMLTVTIPERHPAVRNVSGWLQVPGDTTLTCNYRWTSFATEGGYSLSGGFISVPLGNTSMRDGGTIDFEMYRPPREDADGGCIP
jgi:hypothetical protein